MRLRLIFAAGIAALALVIPLPAHGAPQPWHARNAPISKHPVKIYKSSNCTTGDGWQYLQPGATALSNEWDSMAGFGSYLWRVTVYSGTTGNVVDVKERVSPTACIKLYDANDYNALIPIIV